MLLSYVAQASPARAMKEFHTATQTDIRNMSRSYHNFAFLAHVDEIMRLWSAIDMGTRCRRRHELPDKDW